MVDNGYSMSTTSVVPSPGRDGLIMIDNNAKKLIALDNAHRMQNNMNLPDHAHHAHHPHHHNRIVSAKKRARFALSNNEVFPIPHINDMCDDEVKSVWYEKHDYDQIKADIIPIVKRIMKGDKIEETDQMTIRGLEYRTRKGAIKRQHNKVEAITAVLDEQDRQIELDILDPELISHAYLEISANCLKEAQQLAVGDIISAATYLSETNTTNYYSDNDESCASYGTSQSGGKQRPGVDKKQSFTKMFKQMRIRRRPSISACSSNGSLGSKKDSDRSLQHHSHNADHPQQHPEIMVTQAV